MAGAGTALMGIGSARGENRAAIAAQNAIASPLLEADIQGAKGVLLSIAGGSDLGLFEINEAARLVQNVAATEANIIFGAVIDDTLGDEVRVTVIAAGFADKDLASVRRSYDIPPPPMDKSNPDHPAHYPIYKNIDKNLIPDAESLKDTFKRVIPYYEKNILPILKKEKNVIISAHGNSLRSLCKKIFNITDGSIVELEIPTGNPQNYIQKYHFREWLLLPTRQADTHQHTTKSSTTG